MTFEEEVKKSLSVHMVKFIKREYDEEMGPIDDKVERLGCDPLIPGTKCRSYICVNRVEGTNEKHTASLIVGARLANSDKLYWCYFKSGSREEIIDYIQSEEGQNAVIAKTKKFAERAEDDD